MWKFRKLVIGFASLIMILFVGITAAAERIYSPDHPLYKIDACYSAVLTATRSPHLVVGECDCKESAGWSCSVPVKKQERGTSGVVFAFADTEIDACAKAKERGNSKWYTAEDKCTCGPRSNDVFCFVINHEKK